MKTLLLMATVITAVAMCSQPTSAQTVSAPQDRRTPIRVSPQAPQKQGAVVKITGKNASLTFPPLRIPRQAGMPMTTLPSLSPKPVPISTPVKLQMIARNGPMSSYATLSLKNPAVAGQAEIRFLSPIFVWPDEDGTPLALFGASLGLLAIRINAESNSLYLVDCAVSTTAITSGGVTTFSITEMGSAEAQQVSVKDGHLLFILDAPAAGWYEHVISNEHVGWTPHSCTVSSRK
jgi:hypothetical protein